MSRCLASCRGNLSFVWLPDQLINSPISSHAESIRYPIDVVEPRRDQRDLQDSPVIEAYISQACMVGRGTLRCISRELDDVVKHRAILARNRRLPVVSPQHGDKFFIQTRSTQKLCVRFDSIKAPVRNRDHGCDHLVLAAGERQVRRHQYSKRRESMI
jgi:hypothetical protein